MCSVRIYVLMYKCKYIWELNYGFWISTKGQVQIKKIRQKWAQTGH